MMGNGLVTKVTVTVRADQDAGSGGIVWSYDCQFQPPGKGVNHGDRMHIKGTDPAEITFDLDDHTGLGLQFRGSGTDAIWITEGPGCPGAPGDGNGEFSIDPKPANKRLSITDQNSRESEFHYRLWFDSRDGVKDYDPIIINRAI